VEQDAIIQESNTEKGEEEYTAEACSWCGRDEANDESDDQKSVCDGNFLLFLCDDCPRAFCFRCVRLAHGEGGNEIVERLQFNASSHWRCLACEPTELMARGQLKMKHLIASTKEEDMSDGSINGNVETEEGKEKNC